MLRANRERRLIVLEQQAAPERWLDPSDLTDTQIEIAHCALTELDAGTITLEEADTMLTDDAVFPYPLRSEPIFSRPRFLRVLLNGEVAWLSWHGFPGHVSQGWEGYLQVQPDGSLKRPVDPTIPEGPE